jgi:hypothetical protein
MSAQTDRIGGLKVVHARQTAGLATVQLQAERPWGTYVITLALQLGEMADGFLAFLEQFQEAGDFTIVSDSTVRDTRLVAANDHYWTLERRTGGL